MKSPEPSKESLWSESGDLANWISEIRGQMEVWERADRISSASGFFVLAASSRSYFHRWNS